MRRSFTFFLILFCIPLYTYPASKSGDPFAPYLDSAGKPSRSISHEERGAIVVKRFTFSSREGRNEVFAITGEPAAEGKYPVLLFLHGGGSSAEAMDANVRKYAEAGYVTMAIDLPGLCGIKNSPYSNGPWKSREAGEEPRLDVRNGASNSTVVDAEVAGIEAVNYLIAHPKADPQRIGITGYSWGGYSTTMLAGLLGGKIKAVYAVFGCGFWDYGSFWQDKIEALPQDERKVWLQYIDAGRRAGGIKAAYFIEAPTNDTYFWPPAVSATLGAVRSEKNHAWAPNIDHRQLSAGPRMQQLYFDYHLKGSGQPFVKTGAVRSRKLPGGSLEISCKADIPAGISIKAATLYYAPAQGGWTARKWEAAAMEISGATLKAILPAGANVNYFVCVEDSRRVVTSSDMYDKFK